VALFDRSEYSLKIDPQQSLTDANVLLKMSDTALPRTQRAEAHYRAGIALNALKRYAEALVHFDSAEALDANHVGVKLSKSTVQRAVAEEQSAQLRYVE